MLTACRSCTVVEVLYSRMCSQGDRGAPRAWAEHGELDNPAAQSTAGSERENDLFKVIDITGAGTEVPRLLVY